MKTKNVWAWTYWKVPMQGGPTGPGYTWVLVLTWSHKHKQESEINCLYVTLLSESIGLNTLVQRKLLIPQRATFPCVWVWRKQLVCLIAPPTCGVLFALDLWTLSKSWIVSKLLINYTVTNMFYVGEPIRKKGTFTGSPGRHFYHKLQHLILLLVWTYPKLNLLLIKILP